MEGLGITFEELDYKNIETRRVIWTLLDEARHTLGREINPCDKMLIEVSKNCEGGCKICFTVMPDSTFPSGRLVVKKEQNEVLAMFSSFSSLSAFFGAHRDINEMLTYSELYTYNGEYAAIFEPLPKKRAHLILSLTEYAEIYPPTAPYLSTVREHGKLIMRGNFPLQAF